MKCPHLAVRGTRGRRRTGGRWFDGRQKPIEAVVATVARLGFHGAHVGVVGKIEKSLLRIAQPDDVEEIRSAPQADFLMNRSHINGCQRQKQLSTPFFPRACLAMNGGCMVRRSARIPPLTLNCLCYGKLADVTAGYSFRCGSLHPLRSCSTTTHRVVVVPVLFYMVGTAEIELLTSSTLPTKLYQNTTS